MATCIKCGKAFEDPYQSESFLSEEHPKKCPACARDAVPLERLRGEMAFETILTVSTPRVFLTPSLMVLNILVFVLMVFSGVSLFDPSTGDLLTWGADFGPMTVRAQWWRLFTSTFVHVGIVHLALNMWCLWSLGMLAERMFGNWAFLMLYLIAGLSASMASICWNPDLVSAGASGAVFGVVGGLISFSYLAGGLIPKEEIKKVGTSGMSFVAYNIIYGLTEPRIDMAGHIGGLIAGLALGALLRRPLPPPSPMSLLRYTGVLAVSAATFFAGARIARPRVDDSPLGRYVAAAEHMDEGKLDQAIEDTKYVLERRPDFQHAYKLLGDIFRKKQQSEDAIAAYRKAVEIQPKFAEAYRSLGGVYSKLGRYDDAIGAEMKATELEPQNADMHSSLAFDLLAKGEFEPAREEYRQALRWDPADLERLRHVAFCYFVEGRFEDANREFTGYMDKENVPDVYALIWHALTLRHLGKVEEAQTLLDKQARRFGGEEWENYLFRFQHGTLTESELLARAKSQGELCEANFLVGSAYFLKGDRQTAGEFFRKSEETKVYNYFEYAGAVHRLKQVAAKE